MKAMILAAGLGTRLKPLTDSIPKALVEVDGVPMLERVIISLKQQGFDNILVNVHHFPVKIKEFLKRKDFGIEINISDESEELLDTGGGIAKAAPILFQYDSEPVLIHNVDILSNADLQKIITKSREFEAGIVMVSDRESSRKLIFDSEMKLKGWHNLKDEEYKPEGIFPLKDTLVKEFAFSGIYSLTQENVDEMKKLLGYGKYSVVDYFIHSRRKQEIKGILQNNLKLLDIGKPAALAQASGLLKELNL